MEEEEEEEEEEVVVELELEVEVVVVEGSESLICGLELVYSFQGGSTRLRVGWDGVGGGEGAGQNRTSSRYFEKKTKAKT